MRIIAGEAKGRRLRSLKGQALRPTSDRVRETLFAILGERVTGARFLDLFAGAGAVGLEALSRGASEAVFVESHRAAARVIEENAALCGFAARARVLVMPVGRALPRLARAGERFEIIFLDPPYGSGEAAATLERMARRPGLVAAGGLVICQRSRSQEMPERAGALTRMRQERFGETMLDFYCAVAEVPLQ
jgi:16S rRNA (guanine(966)-N(2))-methyltransferase RsmD